MFICLLHFMLFAISTLLLYTLYLEIRQATEDFKGALPTLADTKNKVGRPHEERHEMHQKNRDNEHFITEQRTMDGTSSYDVPQWPVVIVIILKLTYSSDLDFSSVSLRFRPRFFKPRTISSSFLGREGILFSVSLTGVRLSLGRRSGVTVSFFCRMSSLLLDRVCFVKE
jgi:hypothetical protein